MSQIPVPEIIDPVLTKTSPKRSFCMTENERFGLVFTKTGSINSGTDLREIPTVVYLKISFLRNEYIYVKYTETSWTTLNNKIYKIYTSVVLKFRNQFMAHIWLTIRTNLIRMEIRSQINTCSIYKLATCAYEWIHTLLPCYRKTGKTLHDSSSKIPVPGQTSQQASKIYTRILILLKKTLSK